MPLITSCPECNTQFIVTKEQLKAYEGKVRCGTCNHVFNAKDHLVKSTKTKKPDQANIDTVLSDVSLTEDAIPETVEGEYIEITIPSGSHPTFEDEPDFSINPKSATFEADSPSLVKDLTFEDKFNKKSSSRFSWPLFILSTILLLGLISQLAYFMRTEISANYPQTKPWLNLACAQLGCKIELPKKIDLLTIDDSDMQENVEHENVLQFSSTLINHANFAQAYPAIELTLTNTDDEPVLRRSFTAKEYLADNVNVNNGISAKEEVRIKLNLNTTDIAVAGYRVSLNY